ncbi:MAG: DUF2478 domain-containing protein [Deltaproteobacteria bacterium]|nr:DUF2478 domain-containing protein [Deltaproteobacteria bacterium]
MSRSEREGRWTRIGLSALALGCIGLQFGGHLAWSAIALAIWLLALGCMCREALRRLWMPRFWGLSAVFALGCGLLLGPRDLALGPLSLSGQGLASGALMMVRGAFIFALAAWASRSLDGAWIRALARRAGAEPLAESIAVAMRLLPDLSLRLAHARAEAQGWRSLHGLAVTLVAETGRLACEMAGQGKEAAIALAERPAGREHRADGADAVQKYRGAMLSGSPERPHAGSQPPAVMVAVVGEPDSGKTRTVELLVEKLAQAGLRPAGVRQPKQLDEQGQRLGYELADVATGERRPFARRAARPDRQRGFDFDPQGWAWAAERIRTGASQADFVVVDELGWLEADGQGHLAAIHAAVAAAGRARFYLLGVRASCARSIQARLGAFARSIPADAADWEIEDLVGWLCQNRKGRNG